MEKLNPVLRDFGTVIVTCVVKDSKHPFFALGTSSDKSLQSKKMYFSDDLYGLVMIFVLDFRHNARLSSQKLPLSLVTLLARDTVSFC